MKAKDLIEWLEKNAEPEMDIVCDGIIIDYDRITIIDQGKDVGVDPYVEICI